MRKEGHSVQILDDEPIMNDYETLIFEAVPISETMSEQVFFAGQKGITDTMMFSELVVFLKEEIKARHENTN